MAESLAIMKKNIVDVVSTKVRELTERGELSFPPNYSPDNALKSGWLKLQSTVDKNGKPVLASCTSDSIANSLLDMVVQGLTVMKDQGYFIAYGQRLTFFPSYFGVMNVAKRVTGAKEIFAQVVYEGDEFEFEIKRGRKTVTKHVQTMKSINKAVIDGAYCTLIFSDDQEYTDFMTLAEIHQSWKQSKQNPMSENSTHSKFPGEMAKRTVINRACKMYIKSSDDSSLIIKHFKRSMDATGEAEVEEEIAENANKTAIDVGYTEIDEETGEIMQDAGSAMEPEKVAAPF